MAMAERILTMDDMHNADRELEQRSLRRLQEQARLDQLAQAREEKKRQEEKRREQMAADNANRAKEEEARAQSRMEDHAAQLAKTSPGSTTPSKGKSKKSLKPCECGCGEQTRSRWFPGHDARFYGWIKKICEGTATAPVDVPESLREKVLEAVANGTRGHGSLAPRWDVTKGESKPEKVKK